MEPNHVKNATSLVYAVITFRPLYLEFNFSDKCPISAYTGSHVSWFSPHPDRYVLGKPVELWCPTLFGSFGLQSFVPIQNIHCRCAHGLKEWHDERLLVVVPIIE